MRWDNLRLIDPADRAGMTAPLFEQGAVVRTFDTPEFRGMTFYEVRAKSIINRVPEPPASPSAGRSIHIEDVHMPVSTA